MTQGPMVLQSRSTFSCISLRNLVCLPTQYGLKKKEEKEAEEKAALEQPCEGSLTRPKKAIPAGCGDDEDEDEESILDTVLKYLPGPLQDMFKKQPPYQPKFHPEFPGVANSTLD